MLASRSTACGAGTASTTAANGPCPLPSSPRIDQPPLPCEIVATRDPVSTASPASSAFTGAFIAGTPASTGPPAAASAPVQVVTRPLACQSATAAVNDGSRARRYCAPWSKQAPSTRRCASRPPTERPLSNMRTDVTGIGQRAGTCSTGHAGADHGDGGAQLSTATSRTATTPANRSTSSRWPLASTKSSGKARIASSAPSIGTTSRTLAPLAAA